MTMKKLRFLLIGLLVSTHVIYSMSECDMHFEVQESIVSLSKNDKIRLVVQYVHGFNHEMNREIRKIAPSEEEASLVKENGFLYSPKARNQFQDEIESDDKVEITSSGNNDASDQLVAILQAIRLARIHLFKNLKDVSNEESKNILIGQANDEFKKFMYKIFGL